MLADEDTGAVRLWEPAHGEVLAQPRSSYRPQEPGSRAYASAGLPGADWWVTGRVAPRPERAKVDMEAVDRLYAENGLWAAALA